MKKSPSINFSSVGRYLNKRNSIYPGPTSYNIERKIGKSESRISLSPKKKSLPSKIKVTKMGPGPSDYNPNDLLTKSKSKGISFGSDKRFDILQFKKLQKSNTQLSTHASVSKSMIIQKDIRKVRNLYNKIDKCSFFQLWNIQSP